MDLQGRKTYILAAAGAVVTGLYILKLIDRVTWEGIMGMIVSGAAATIKMGQTTETAKIAAVQKVETAKVEAKVETVQQSVEVVQSQVAQVARSQ